MILTPRQQEILKDVLDGLSNEQISKKRFIELSTIKTHVMALYKAFNVSSRAMLIAKIYKNKINKIKEIVGGTICLD